MKTVRIVNKTQNKVLCARCAVADNLVTRVRGLLGRTGLDEDEGLLITRCPSIHMFGMKFPIDVLFLSRDDVVVDWVENIAPGKMYVAKTPENADKTSDQSTLKPVTALELPAGAIARSGVNRFDQLAREVL